MKFAILAAAFCFAVSAPAFADDAPMPMKSPSPSPTATMAAKPDKAAMQARAQDCSKEADARGLHLKARKEFRAKCMKGEK